MNWRNSRRNLPGAVALRADPFIGSAQARHLLDDESRRHVFLRFPRPFAFGAWLLTRAGWHLVRNLAALRRERNGSRSGERGGERGEDAEVGVERDTLKPSHAEWLQPALVLEPPEGALDRGASPVQVAPPLRLAGDKRVQATRLDPGGLRLALPGRAAPLARLPLGIGPGECPSAVLTLGRLVLPRDNARGLLERDDRQTARLVAGVVDWLRVVAQIHRNRLGLHPLADRLQQIIGKARLVRSRRLDAPCDGKLCPSADGEVQLPAVEAAPLPSRDSGAMPPRGVRVAVALALRDGPVFGGFPRPG